MVRRGATLDNGEAAIEVVDDVGTSLYYLQAKTIATEDKPNGKLVDVILTVQATKVSKAGDPDLSYAPVVMRHTAHAGDMGGEPQLQLAAINMFIRDYVPLPL